MQGTEMGTPHMSRHHERMLLLYDTNKDGKITVAEINDDQARIFTAMDVDGDKSLSVDELKRRGRSLQIFRTTTIFDLLDVNGDGKLSVAEVNAPSKRWFKRYDANNDGAMEASELPAGRHHGRRGWRGHR
jgi:Ca2+-binding EF-hand superfamily protein